MGSCKDDTTILTPLVHDETPYELELNFMPAPQIPDDNTLTIEGVKLGRQLFYETDLSSDGTMSCGSCHRQEHAFSDSNRLSIGVRGLPGKRQAMAIVNLAWNTNEFFWDGRAHLLRDQALMPIQDELEMDETLDNVVQKLSSQDEYKDQFFRAFGSKEINSYKISLALEQFMNSLVSTNSKWDRYMMGLESLSDLSLIHI